MRIALCIPCYDGRVHDAHMLSVVKTMRLARDAGIEIMTITGRGNAILPEVRNWCVAQALLNECDKVWFVDSDIAWDQCAEDVINMLVAPVDIVAGVHQKRNSFWNEKASLVVKWKNIPPDKDPETGLYAVNSVATAFVAIDCSLFKRIDEAGLVVPYLPNWSDHKLPDPCVKFYRNYFWLGFEEVNLPQANREALEAIGVPGPYRQLQGEDYYFCSLARKVGAGIFVDPRISLTHFDGCVQHNASLKDVRFVDATQTDQPSQG